MNKPIPGPKGRPVVGSVFDFAQEGPEFLTRLAAEYGEIARFNVFHHSMYLISNPALIREVLITKSKLFPKGKRDLTILKRFVGEGLVTTNGEQHKRQRKLAQPAFHMGRISNYGETMVDYAQHLTAGWSNGQQIDMSDQMMELTMFIVCKTLFDADWATMEDVAKQVGTAIEELQDVTDDSFSLPMQIPLWVPTRNNRRTNAARSVLDRIINQIVAERRACARDGQIEDTGDLLSMLLMAEYDDGSAMDDGEIRDQLVTMFVAGHETTSNALTWTWYLLSQHPEVEAQMHNELDTILEGRSPTLVDLPQLPYTEMVLKESMRIYPPAWLLNTRQALEETTIGDYTVPKDGLVMISPYVMHRHPSYFDDPMRFDPERFRPENEAQIEKYTYLPFGAGPRVCIGHSFAMMEAHLILATLAQRFRFELEPTEEIAPNAQVTMSPANGMKMTVVERKPSRPESAQGLDQAISRVEQPSVNPAAEAETVAETVAETAAEAERERELTMA